MIPPRHKQPAAGQPADHFTARLNPLGLSLRRMTPADLPQIMTIEQTAYATPWPEAAYRQELNRDRAYFEVARHRHTIIGYSGMWHFVDEAHLGTLVTHPAARGKGIGALLLANIIHRALALPVHAVTLEVRPSNRAAMILYAKFGFEEVGRRKNYYPDREDAIIMTTPDIHAAPFQAAFNVQVKSLFERLAFFGPEHPATN
ncbi:MAG: ribosomal protein S18-alanine N-acetyltransferase [Anaerolineae bacterium]